MPFDVIFLDVIKMIAKLSNTLQSFFCGGSELSLIGDRPLQLNV